MAYHVKNAGRWIVADEQQTQVPPVEAKAMEQPSATPAAEPKTTETPAEEKTIPYNRFKEVNDKLRKLEEDATKQAKAQQEAEERRKVEQGEWQKLAEERKTQLEQLSPKSELADRLSEMVTKQLDTEIATWPESVRAIMPAEDAPLLERIEWADRTRPLAQELLAVKTPNGTPYPAQHAGTGGTPAPMKVLDKFQQEIADKAKAVKNPLLRN